MEKMKRYGWRGNLILTLILCLHFGFVQEASAGGFTYWTANGVPIVTATGDQNGPIVGMDAGSGAIMVWSDFRSGSSYAIYAQRIDYEGNALWTPNGVAIYSGTTVGSAWPRLTFDRDGGSIIIWTDNRDGNNNLYAQRVNGSGQLLWDTDGVLITNSLYSLTESGQYRIVTDESSGAIICWQDGRNISTSERDIYCQRIDANGNVQWPANGVAIVTASDIQRYPRMTIDGAGGAIITWQDYRSGSPQAYAQRINNNGVVQWAADGINLTPSSEANGNPFPLNDKRGGAYVIWRDYRGGEYKFYAQRVNSDGNTQWTSGGVAISGSVGSYSTYGGTTDNSGKAWVTWRDVTYTTTYTTAGLFAQKLEDDGTLVWGASGVQISTAPINPASSTYNVSIEPDHGGGAFIAWDDYRSGTNWNIYAQNVDGAGNMRWDANGMAISAASGHQLFPSTRSTNLTLFIAWRDSRTYGSSGYDIYAQRVASGDTYFSHFDSTAGSWWTGVALANPNSSSASVTLTAYNQSGTQIGNSNITLPAYGQRAFQVSDPTLLNVSGTGWIEIVPDRRLIGLEIFGNITSGGLAGLNPYRLPSNILVFSHFDSTADWWTGIALANPNSSSASVTLTAFNQSGTQLGSSNITIPANGQKAFQVSDPTILNVSGTGWIYVESDQPITGLEIFGNINTGQITGVPGAIYPNTTLYFPHFDSTAGSWWTGIALANPNSSSASVTLTIKIVSGVEQSRIRDTIG